MSNHTPGPWEVKGTWIVNSHYQEEIATVVRVHGEDVEFKATANLIAAAPDLLEALEEAVYMRGIPDDDEDRNGYEKRLMAAIAKAKGETG